MASSRTGNTGGPASGDRTTFDPARYPDPTAMVDAVHRANAHIIISVWPRFDLGLAHTAELEKAGALYPPVYPNVYPKGQGKWYDPFHPDGRRLYWKFFRKNSSHAASTAGGWTRARRNSAASGARCANSRPAPGRARRCSTPTRSCTRPACIRASAPRPPAKRVFILTRSAWAGQQRNAAVTWSGDTRGNWEVFRQQIPAGLNFVASGIPVLEHRHRRILRRRPGRSQVCRAVHALVPVRRVLPDVPRPRHRQAEGDVALRRSHPDKS